MTVVSEVLIILVVPLSAYAIERHNSKATKFVYAYFTAGMMIPFHLYMFPLFKEMKVFHIYGTLWGPRHLLHRRLLLLARCCTPAF